MKPVAPVSAMRGLYDEAGLVAAAPSLRHDYGPRGAWPPREANLTTGASFGRIFERKPQDLAVTLVSQGIDRAIWSLLDVADAGA